MKIFDVTKFGAAGDGIQDDGPAIRRAIAAAVGAGSGATVILKEKAYRIGNYSTSHAQFHLEDVHDLTIEGKGARLLNSPGNSLFTLAGCHNVVISGFTVDYDPLTFTQGTINAVDSTSGTIDLQLHDGYPLPPEDAWVYERGGTGGWEWGCVMDPQKRHRRWDIFPHFFIKSVQALEIQERTYRITVMPQFAQHLGPVRLKDRFFLPLCQGSLADRHRTTGNTTSIVGSTDCVLENFSIYGALNGMVFNASRNEGRITLRNITITYKPGTDRIVSTWRDGMHVKDNRLGPLIEDCSFEGMLDDSINISANTAMAVEIISETEYWLVGPPFYAGDRVMVFDPASGRIIAETSVVHAQPKQKGVHVVLQSPVKGVTAGSKRPHTDLAATHFYNMSYCNSGYIVRNCTFLPQRRHALLVRSPDALIEGNYVDGVGGSAVRMGNEMGSFYEGPFPSNVIIRNNTFRNTQDPAICIYTSGMELDNKALFGDYNRFAHSNAPGTGQGIGHYTRNIEVTGNSITPLPGQPAIIIRQASDVRLKDNNFTTSDGKDMGEGGIQLTGADNVRIE